MNRILGVGYGFEEKETREFTLDSPSGMWRPTFLGKLNSKGDIERREDWRILKWAGGLERAIERLTSDLDVRDELRRRAQPVLLVQTGPKTWRQDFTLYLEPNSPELDRVVEACFKHYQQSQKPRLSYECKLFIWDDQAGWFAEGRALACRCNNGRSWSVTFRKKRDSTETSEEHREEPFNDITDISSLLSDLIFGKAITDEQRVVRSIKDRHGLIVVAGRTGVAKSLIATKLIERYMDAKPAPKRTPHLVTYEDPIEEPIYRADDEGKDYTPRQLKQDVRDIDHAIKDALRQTPRIMFVGETRDTGQWKQLLHFAGTGHLVITTTHAGSLTEAVGNILQAAKAAKPRARSIVAERLLAVIHLRAAKTKYRQFILPALWLRTPIGSKALMAEGLSSLLPTTPPRLDDAWGLSDFPPGSTGRYWFARELVKATKSITCQTAKSITEEKDEVLRQGLEWDLEGI